ncbi:MAG TPA: disulfide isomerase DsbC N-terminal domain-containing protein [Thermodesulfobacteriota bacterium]|nr:disulfide isomerase DsbC N-terminal domain-containing protein [Thermodesulfobacteriota bacterium]
MLRRDMSKISLLACLLLLCLPPNPCFCFEGKGQDCSKCHTLSNDEARDLLKEAIPDIKIVNVKLGPPKGFWEVYLESRGRKGLVYVYFDKNHFFGGPLFSVMEKKNLTQERLEELNKVDVSQIPLNDAVVLGDQKARIKVISFSDPD